MIPTIIHHLGENRMPITKRTHLIPRIYLRNFSPWPNRRNPKLYLYPKQGSSKLVTVENACVQCKFYSPETEKFMANRVEREIASFLQDMRAMWHLPANKWSVDRITFNRKKIALFIENMILRTFSYREQIEAELKNPQSFLNRYLDQIPSIKEKVGRNPQNIQEMLLQQKGENTLGSIIYNSDFTFISNLNFVETPFISSDNPVLHNIPETSIFTLISSKNPPVIFLPLTPSVGLMISGLKRENLASMKGGNNRYEIWTLLELEQILGLNARLYLQSRFIIMHIDNLSYFLKIQQHAKHLQEEDTNP